MSRDTSPEQMRRYIDGLRRRTPAERAQQMGDLCEGVRALALVGLRRRHPQATPAELDLLLAKRIYGAQVVERVQSSRAVRP